MAFVSNHLTALCVLYLMITIDHAYFLPAITLPVHDAYRYCEDVCHSDIASNINININIIEAITTVNQRPQSIWGAAGVDEPDLILIQRDAFYQSTPYHNFLDLNEQSEHIVACDNTTSFRFLCNDCNGVITKYAAIPKSSTQVNGSALCEEQYESSLASIHSDRDQSEIEKIWNISRSTTSSMWIGLEHDTDSDYANEDGFTWTDDTEYDYGSNHIQSVVGGAFGCTSLRHDGQWTETDCHLPLSKPLCNVPSELSLSLSNWTMVQSASVVPDTFDFVQNPADSLQVAIADKQWFNGDGPLLIDYTFTVDFLGTQGTSSSLVLLNGISGSICDHYLITIQRGGGGYYYLALEHFGDEQRVLNLTILPIIWENDEFYLLSIEVGNGTDFVISFNGDVYLEYEDTVNSGNALNNGYSGYIGLLSDSGIATTAKSLYVSGTPMSSEILDVTELCSTYYPTFAPTVRPTANPTISSTTTTGTSPSGAYYPDIDTVDSSTDIPVDDSDSGWSLLITDNVIIAAILGMVIMCCIAAMVFVCSVWVCATVKFKYHTNSPHADTVSLKSPSSKSGVLRTSPETEGPGSHPGSQRNSKSKMPRMITPQSLRLEPGIMSKDGDWVTIGYIEDVDSTERNGKDMDEVHSIDEDEDDEENDTIMELPMINSREAKSPQMGQNCTSMDSMYTRRSTYPEGNSEGRQSTKPTKGGLTPCGPDYMV